MLALLQAGADKDEVTRRGATPLLAAALKGHGGVVRGRWGRAGSCMLGCSW